MSIRFLFSHFLRKRCTYSCRTCTICLIIDIPTSLTNLFSHFLRKRFTYPPHIYNPSAFWHFFRKRCSYSCCTCTTYSSIACPYLSIMCISLESAAHTNVVRVQHTGVAQLGRRAALPHAVAEPAEGKPDVERHGAGALCAECRLPELAR